jgi:formate dehydrogenase iron-sulfur subunit
VLVKLGFPGGDEGVAVIVGLGKCIGYRACQIAYQEWNSRNALNTSFSPTFTNPQDLHADAWKVVFFHEFPVSKTLKFAEAEVTVNTVEVVSVPYNCLHHEVW